MAESWIVVTDLDGTLLDHHSYSWEPASEALALLKKQQIPLVLCSSKTAAEMDSIRLALETNAPFIAENGGAVYLFDNDTGADSAEVVSFGMNRADIIKNLESIKQELGVKYTGFSDMSINDLVEVTGLDSESAMLALQREFTEPLLWEDSDDSRVRFIKHLGKAGLEGVQGGRFLHVSSGCDKGAAVNWLKKHMEKLTGKPQKVIALGDSDNDVGMLEAADWAVLVKSPVRGYPSVENRNQIKTLACGPEGWNDAIKTILKTTGQSDG